MDHKHLKEKLCSALKSSRLAKNIIQSEHKELNLFRRKSEKNIVLLKNDAKQKLNEQLPLKRKSEDGSDSNQKSIPDENKDDILDKANIIKQYPHNYLNHKNEENLIKSKSIAKINSNRPTNTNQETENSSNKHKSSSNKQKSIPIIIDISRKECNLCGKTTIFLLSKKLLASKYMTTMDSFNIKIINDIISNENNHIVSIFKDYLIYDDTNEFLKRFYSIKESKPRMPKIVDYYEQSTKMFPNYINLPESKFMFKSIERKQICIDERQEDLENAKNIKLKLEQFSNFPNKIFTTKFMDKLNSPDSILSSIDNSVTLLQSYFKNSKNLIVDSMQKNLECISVNNLLERLNSKDTIVQEKNEKGGSLQSRKNSCNNKPQKHAVRNKMEWKNNEIFPVSSNVVFRSLKNLSTKNFPIENPDYLHYPYANINTLEGQPVDSKLTKTIVSNKPKINLNVIQKNEPLKVNIFVNNGERSSKTRNKDKIEYKLRSQKDIKTNLIIESNTKIRLKSQDKTSSVRQMNMKFNQLNKTPESKGMRQHKRSSECINQIAKVKESKILSIKEGPKPKADKGQSKIHKESSSKSINKISSKNSGLSLNKKRFSQPLETAITKNSKDVRTIIQNGLEKIRKQNATPSSKRNKNEKNYGVQRWGSVIGVSRHQK